MRSLIFERPGALHWEECDEPLLTGAGDALVRPVVAATCDVDTAVLRGLVDVPGPFPLGHEAVAEVVEVAADVATVAPGDLVVVPFQISCGACGECRSGRTGTCTAQLHPASYGMLPLGGDWGGLFADLARVPHADAMLVKVPAGVDLLKLASAGDNLPAGYRAVGPPLARRPGGEVLVVGGGNPSIGLYAVGFALALGSSAVVYIDDDERRRVVAGVLGAEVLERIPPHPIGRFPVTVDASCRPEGLAFAVRSTVEGGLCTSTGIYYVEPPLTMLGASSAGVTLETERPHARALMPKVLEVVAGGGFDPTPVAEAVVDWDDAPEILAEPPDKTLLVRPA
ncbi:MAG: alcohol dehydrogenase catalytic domain-containing protein [Acidimicrobiia bacterium]